MSRPMNLVPFEEPAWQPGLPIADPVALRTALDLAAPALVKLPVYLERDANPLRAYAVAYVGTGPLAAGARLDLRLQDAALGVSLADRVRQHCKGGQGCCLWLVGRWNVGELIAQVAPEEGLVPFSLRSVRGPYQEGEPAWAYIEQR